MTRVILSLILAAASICSCAVEEKLQNITYEITLGKVPMSAVWQNGDDTTWSVWGTSMVKGEDDLYHIFYSRWPKKFGWSWVVDSEIAHATSKSPYGPWEFSDVTLPRRGKEYWDGWCTHNPTIHKIDGKYYLYYMGNTGDGEILCSPGTKQIINWQHRNNQRIGVAVAESPYGPWKRFDKPLIDVSEDKNAYDCMVTSNPSACQMEDGSMLFVYKAVGAQNKAPNYGPVVHMVATAEGPTGPITKHKELAFHVEGVRFAAEDPYIWYSDGKYRAIVKSMANTNAKTKRAILGYYESEDGLHWEKSKYHIITEPEITFENGKHMVLDHLERPQVLVENGEPVLLLCAADTVDCNNTIHSFNVQIPLNVKKHIIEEAENE